MLYSYLSYSVYALDISMSSFPYDASKAGWGHCCFEVTVDFGTVKSSEEGLELSKVNMVQRNKTEEVRNRCTN